MERKKVLVLGRSQQTKNAYQTFPSAFTHGPDVDLVEHELVPDDIDGFSSIILTDIPKNVTALRENHTTPIFAIPSLKTALEQQQATDLALVLPEDPVLTTQTITETEKARTTALAEWDKLRHTFKLFYPDIADTVEHIGTERRLPRFSAFYQAMQPEMLNLSPTLPFERAQMELIERVTSYEKARNMQGQTHTGYFRAQAEEALNEFLRHIETHRNELKNKLSIGETAGKGSRILYAAVAADAKYRFLKELRTKNGVNHATIAAVSFTDAKYFRVHDIKIPDSSPPLSAENREATYLIREAIIGPTIEELFTTIRKHREHLPPRDRTRHLWLRQTREICVYKILRDIIKWQHDAPKLPETANKSPDDIARHLGSNLDNAFTTYSTYMPVTDADRRLWIHAAAIFHPAPLQLTPDRIYRHFDASLSNFKINAGRNIRNVKDLEEYLAPRKRDEVGDAARKKLIADIYSVDQGFTYVHEDEDFFHVVTSFGLHDADQTPEEKINRITAYYARFNGFRDRGRKKPVSTAFDLHGYYRCFVSGYRVLSEMHGPLNHASRERVQHRLQLAQAFAEDALVRVNASTLPSTPEELCTLIERTPSDAKQDELRLEGLRYFADKFSRIPSRVTPQTTP